MRKGLEELFRRVVMAGSLIATLLLTGGAAMAASAHSATDGSQMVRVDPYAKGVGATVVPDPGAAVVILKQGQQAWIIYPVRFATFPGETVKTAAIVDGRLELPQAVLAATLDPSKPQPPAPVTTSAPAAPQTVGVDRLLAVIKGVLGTPYRWGGESLFGFDCSGLVQWALGKLGIWVPRTASAQWEYTRPVKHPSAGDLVFFDTDGPGPTHVGVYVGLGQFISASNKGVSWSSLWEPYWSKHYLGARNPFSKA